MEHLFLDELVNLTGEYWTSTEYLNPEVTDYFYSINMDDGIPRLNWGGSSQKYGLAVTGGIVVTPIPGAIWLFCSGLVGLLSLNINFRRSKT